MLNVEGSTENVYKKLKQLRTDKEPGPEEVFSQYLKEVAVEISAPLSAIMRRPLRKQVNVCPIFKKGSKALASNYRRVSLTSQICKIFERISFKYPIPRMFVSGWG